MNKKFIQLFLITLAFIKTALPQTNPPQETPLHFHAQNNNYNELRFLLSDRNPSKYNINAFDQDGYTALHWAAQNGHPFCVYLLERAKADFNITDLNGNTAADLARQHGHDQLANFLTEVAQEQWDKRHGKKEIVITLEDLAPEDIVEDSDGPLAKKMWSAQANAKKISTE
ncbi:ankyrin repeat domain-containing protein [bacterium]|nr:MAG: ankyrin repeat domain-containing protein [bacterium]